MVSPPQRSGSGRASFSPSTSPTQDLANLIVKGLSQRQLMHHVTNSWGLTSEQASRYVREAKDLVKAHLSDIDWVDMLASKVQMLEQIATDAVAAASESNAIGAIRLLNELVGLGAGQKPGAH